MPENFFSIHDPDAGIARKLAEGITTRIFPGDQAMVSLVTVEPGAKGTPHHHPEEQWGYVLTGGGTRFQGEEAVPFGPGDFWRTPGGVTHTVEAGPEGCTILDIFAPPRAAYTKPGEGFASGEKV